MVAEDGVLVSVELSAGHLGGGGHARSVGDTLRNQTKPASDVRSDLMKGSSCGRGTAYVLGIPTRRFLTLSAVHAIQTNDMLCTAAAGLVERGRG